MSDKMAIFAEKPDSSDIINSMMVWILDTFSIFMGIGAGMCIAIAFMMAFRAGREMESPGKTLLRVCLFFGLILFSMVIVLLLVPALEDMCHGCGWSFLYSGAFGALLFSLAVTLIKVTR